MTIRGRGKVAEEPGVSYRTLRRVLELDHGVTAPGNTMQRWLQQLQAGRSAVPYKRPPSMPALPVKSIEELADYDDWGRGKVTEEPDVSYRNLRRVLELDHCAAAPDDTMRRWLQQLQAGRTAVPCQRSPSMHAIAATSI